MPDDVCELDEALGHVEADVAVFVLDEVEEDGHDLGDGDFLADVLGHFAKCDCEVAFEVSAGVFVEALDGWQEEGGDFVCGDVSKEFREGFHGSVLDFCFLVLKEVGVGLKKVDVCDVFAEGFGDFREVLGKGESDFPVFVFTGCENGSKRIRLVLIFGQVLRKGDRSLDADHLDRVLLVLSKSSKNRQELIEHVFLLNHTCEQAEFLRASSSDDGRVFITQLEELLSQGFLVGA